MKRWYWFLALSSYLLFSAGLLLGIVAALRADLKIQRLVSVVNLYQTDLVNDIEHYLISWSTELTDHGHLLESPCDSNIIKNLSTDHRFATYGAADPQGTILCSRGGEGVGVNIADRPYFQEAMSSKNLSMSGFQIGRITNKAVLAYAYPVLNEQLEVVQVVFMGIDLAWMNEFFNQINIPKGSELVVSDPEGRVVVYHPQNVELIGTQAFNIRILSIMFSEKTGQLKLEGVDKVTRNYHYGPVYLDKDTKPDAFLLLGIPGWPGFDIATSTLAALLLGGALASVVQVMVLRKIIK